MIYLFSFQHAVVVKFHRNDCLMRQYRACGIDSLGLGITCIFYHCTMCTSRHDLVSFAFYAIPIFPILIRRILTLLVPSHFYTDFITSSDATGAMLQAARKETTYYIHR